MDKLRQPSDDDRPSLKQLLAQAADLQQQYERDVEQANPYDAAEHDLVEFIRKHHDAIDERDSIDIGFGNGQGLCWSAGNNWIDRWGPFGSGQHEIIPLDAPGDR